MIGLAQMWGTDESDTARLLESNPKVKIGCLSFKRYIYQKITSELIDDLLREYGRVLFVGPEGSYYREDRTDRVVVEHDQKQHIVSIRFG